MANNTNKVKPKFDFSGIDPNNIDPDKLQLGTAQSDCTLIAQTFERGAHSTPTEAAIFSTISRNIQNNKYFALAASENMNTYLNAPQEDAKDAAKRAAEFGEGAGDGSSAPTEQFMQSFNIGSQKQSTYGNSFGDKLLDFTRECIPCDLRLMAFLELHPNIDLLSTLEGHLKTQLKMLIDVGNMLKNFDIYGDFCELLDLLSFMCIPDLQRIIATLMALFILEVPKLDNLIGMLQALIAPIFAPILMAIVSLMDQFTLLVTNPLDCVIDAINQQLKKLKVETPNFSVDVKLKENNPLSQISGGLEQLNTQIQDATQKIKEKLNFYMEQTKAMLGEVGSGDSAYLQAKMNMLNIVRTIAFVSSIITALTKGHAACSSTGKSASNQEIDNFFQNYLNPQSSFNLYLDENGQIHIDEEVPDFVETVDPSTGGLSEFGNVFQFKGESLLDLTIETDVKKAATVLTTPTQVVIPCKLEIDSTDADKVNKWISELNKI